ncbi:MAG: hypothetical protein ABL973_18095 [Micropepsaceae bacterium]
MAEDDLIGLIHPVRRGHPSNSAAFDEFANDWSGFISSAKWGIFDRHFEQRGYPFSTDIVDGSDYHRRPTLESSLLDALREKRDTVVLGNEGGGKTTLLHYVFGFGSYRNPEFTNIVRLNVDARNLDSAHESFNSEVYTTVFAQLQTVKLPDGRSVCDAYARWQDDPAGLEPCVRALLEGAEGRYGLQSFLCFARQALPDCYTFIALDNVDSLSSTTLRRLIAHFESARKRVEQFLKMVQDDGGSRLYFILPCRKSTWSLISNAAIGEFPLSAPRVININGIDDGIWSITKSFVAKRLQHAEVEGRLKRNLVLQIPITDSSTFTPEGSLSQLLSEIIDWVHRKSPETERLISAFSGQSLRRGRMFALKIVGHALIVQNWLSDRQSRHGQVWPIPQTTEPLGDVVREALFDAMQGIGGGVTTTEILLNPFGVIRESNLRRNNPYIGVILLRLICRYWEQIHKQTTYSDEISFERIFDELRAIGYSDEAIRRCVESYCISGVLRPIKHELCLLHGPDQLSTVYPRYTLDVEAFQMYRSLVFRTGKGENTGVASKEHSILFMNACTRANYEVGYVSRPASELYRAFINIRFLRDCVEGERILESLMARSNYRGQFVSYVSEVFPSLRKKWRGVLGQLEASAERSRDEHDRRMLAEAQQMLSHLESELRRTGGSIVSGTK